MESRKLASWPLHASMMVGSLLLTMSVHDMLSHEFFLINCGAEVNLIPQTCTSCYFLSADVFRAHSPLPILTTSDLYSATQGYIIHIWTLSQTQGSAFFTRFLWDNMSKVLSIKLQPTIAYHPQANWHGRAVAQEAAHRVMDFPNWYHQLSWVLLSLSSRVE